MEQDRSPRTRRRRSCSASAPPSRAAIPCRPWPLTSPEPRERAVALGDVRGSPRTPATPPPSASSAASTAACSTCAPRRRRSPGLPSVSTCSASTASTPTATSALQRPPCGRSRRAAPGRSIRRPSGCGRRSRGPHIKVGCSLATGKIARCSVTLVTPSGIVVGPRCARLPRLASAPAWQGRGRAHGQGPQARRPARRRARRRHGRGAPVGGSTPLVAKQTVHVVSSERGRDAGGAPVRERLGGASALRAQLPARPGLAAQGRRRVVATGYTDSLGTAGANYRLGLARADAVCAFISHGAHVACRARRLRRGPPAGDERHGGRPRAQPARRAAADLLAAHVRGLSPQPGTVPACFLRGGVQGRYRPRR